MSTKTTTDAAHELATVRKLNADLGKRLDAALASITRYDRSYTDLLNVSLANSTRHQRAVDRLQYALWEARREVARLQARLACVGGVSR